MKITAFVLACILSCSVNAQQVKFESVKLSDKHYTTNSRATDAAGNIYKTGGLWDKTDFDPGPSEFFLTGTSSRSSDIFISKLSASGKFEWAKKIGKGGFESGESIALDKSGNLYITGSFDGTEDFDPGEAVFNLVCDDYQTHAFILKLDASGNFLWAKKTGENELVYGRSISLDASGNIYTVGTFKGTVDFDSGEGISNLESTQIDGHSKTDMYVLKLDASGNFLWAKNWYGGVSDQDHSIAVDASGNVYTTGDFYGKIDFNPGKENFSLSSKGKTDIFISKLDASGNFVWAKSIGGKLEDEGKSIAADAAGNIYLTGFFSETVDFDPGKGKLEFTAPGSYGEDEKKDIFIVKFNSSGISLWALQIGGDHSDIGKNISVDANNTILLEGDYYGNIDFDPGQGTFYLKPEQAGYYGKASFMLKLSQQ